MSRRRRHRPEFDGHLSGCLAHHDGKPARRRVVGDVELPPQDLDLSHLSRPGRPNPLAAAQAWSEDVWTEQHENCPARWYCESCEEPQCPRCHPSPAEFLRCADCDWRGAA